MVTAVGPERRSRREQWNPSRGTGPQRHAVCARAEFCVAAEFHALTQSVGFEVKRADESLTR